MAKRHTSMTLEEETFDYLDTISEIRRAFGKKTARSAIIDDLVAEYVVANWGTLRNALSALDKLPKEVSMVLGTPAPQLSDLGADVLKLTNQFLVANETTRRK